MQGTNRYARIGLPLLLTLALGLVPALSLARQDDPPPGPPDPQRMLDHMAEKLDLSDQQRQDLAAAFASHKEAMRAGGEKMRAAREALDKQIHADVFNESAIRQAASTVGALEAERAVDRGKLFQQVRGILNDEQLQKFLDMEEHHRERMQEHREFGPPRHGPRY